MLKSATCALVAGGLLSGIFLAGTTNALAQEPTQEVELDLNEGWRYYQRYCQNCHGEEGAGDGRIAHMLKEKPSNLTLLSERNGGVFPAEMVARTIDGREDADIHARREMPIWGKTFREIEEIGDNEEAVHQKILELTEILKSLDRSVQEATEP